jgi:hypothetical protein
VRAKAAIALRARNSFTAPNVRRDAIVVRLAARPSIDDVWSIRASVGNRPAVARPISGASVGTASTACHSASSDSGTGGAAPLTPLSLQSGGDAVSEADIKTLVHAHPACLPIAEIDPMFSGPVPICTELNTSAGPIDIFMVTPSGLPVLVECKLWRNPEGRREVVGQILDYAKELSRWSSSDLQREVSRRLKRDGNSLLEMVWAVDPGIDEIRSTMRSQQTSGADGSPFLIVGDGIREGVEAIAEYLQMHWVCTSLWV